MATTPQSRAALARANEIRLHMADVRKQVAAAVDQQGARDRVVEALADPLLKSWRVSVLLATQRRWGPQRTARLLRRLALPDATLGRLTLRQRGKLAVFLGCPERVDGRGEWVLQDGELVPDPYGRPL